MNIDQFFFWDVVATPLVLLAISIALAAVCYFLEQRTNNTPRTKNWLRVGIFVWLFASSYVLLLLLVDLWSIAGISLISTSAIETLCKYLWIPLTVVICVWLSGVAFLTLRGSHK